ncbi:MAG: DNA-processing protein DprA [Phycisphaerales bacterium]
MPAATTRSDTPSPETLDLLRLGLAPGLGPVLTRRAIETLGSPAAVAGASATALAQTPGIGAERARKIAAALRESDAALEAELALAARHGVRFVAAHDDEYPPLLRDLEDAPLALRVRGELVPELDRFGVAIVGSRSCTAYGMEQAERFSAALAERGLPVVSGGARGIDTAAHRAALRVRGRTVVVMGCGHAHCYPPENAALFEKVVEGGGCIVSELPLAMAPARENFPARNRVISGMALGVLVIEAGARSGALITARLAAEEHGREVMALPGRVDSGASQGAHELIRSGGAALVMTPADVIETLESPARHAHAGTHAARYADPAREPAPKRIDLATLDLTDRQRVIVEALAEPRTLDEVVRLTGLDASAVRTEATLLEVQRVLRRVGDRLAVGAG